MRGKWSRALGKAWADAFSTAANFQVPEGRPGRCTASDSPHAELGPSWVLRGPCVLLRPAARLGPLCPVCRASWGSLIPQGCPAVHVVRVRAPEAWGPHAAFAGSWGSAFPGPWIALGTGDREGLRWLRRGQAAGGGRLGSAPLPPGQRAACPLLQAGDTASCSEVFSLWLQAKSCFLCPSRNFPRPRLLKS